MKPRNPKYYNKDGNLAWGKRLLGGYAGLKHTSKEIARIIPKRKAYVEPLAGLGRVFLKYYALHKPSLFLLNDKSQYAYEFMNEKFLPQMFPESLMSIMKIDWLLVLDIFDKHNDCLVFLDFPWNKGHYNNEDTKAFIDRDPKVYYEQFFNYIKENNPKFDWVVAGNANNKQIIENCKYTVVVRSEKPIICGKYAKTLLGSNKPFYRWEK